MRHRHREEKTASGADVCSEPRNVWLRCRGKEPASRMRGTIMKQGHTHSEEAPPRPVDGAPWVPQAPLPLGLLPLPTGLESGGA